ncbi:MAG TPA: TylF/MycF/NovP-related O-methyltransferase [Candidatus Angelobacter sp.]|jgi:hypothetical protein
MRRTKLYRYLRWKILDSWPYLAWTDIFNPANLLLAWRLFPYTQQNLAGLLNVRRLARLLDQRGVPGAFVECGIWRGGCAAVMGRAAEASGRQLWLFDSFEGMPEASSRDIGDAAEELSHGRNSGAMVPVGSNVASLQEVSEFLHRKMRIAENTIVIKKGWFQNTVPSACHEIGSIAMLRIDADWYESTLVCLEELYDNVVDGGFIIIDDYGWFPGCRAAVDEFLASRNLTPQLVTVDYTRVYFQKNGASHKAVKA